MRGTDVITAGFPCQSFSGAGFKEGLNDPRGKIIFHIIEMCRAIRPPFLVLECVWEFFKNPTWRGTATDGFGELGYHCHVRQEQAARYLPQYRSRGIMIVTRDDIFNRAMGLGIGDLFTAAVGGTNPTIESSRL
eukprot:10395390-Heterocapsa_arctica.AAC.1